MQERHESDCSVYNMPAYPNKPCDCKYKEANKGTKQLDINLRTAWVPRDWEVN